MTEYLLAQGWLGLPRLALVPCSSSSEALISLRLVLEGNGPSTDDIAAVLGSWEQRFGARLIDVQPFALDADIVFQGFGSFDDYADELIDDNLWTLWWD